MAAGIDARLVIRILVYSGVSRYATLSAMMKSATGSSQIGQSEVAIILRANGYLPVEVVRYDVFADTDVNMPGRIGTAGAAAKANGVTICPHRRPLVLPTATRNANCRPFRCGGNRRRPSRRAGTLRQRPTGRASATFRIESRPARRMQQGLHHRHHGLTGTGSARRLPWPASP